MIGPIGVEQKESASDGHWINHVALIYDLTHDLDGDFNQSQILKNTLPQEWLVWLMWNKKEAYRLYAWSIMRPFLLSKP